MDDVEDRRVQKDPEFHWRDGDEELEDGEEQKERKIKWVTKGEVGVTLCGDREEWKEKVRPKEERKRDVYLERAENSNTKTSFMHSNTSDSLSSNKEDKFIRICEIWNAKNGFSIKGLFIKGPKSDSKAKYFYWIVYGLIQLLYLLIISPYMFKVSILLFTFNFWMLLLTISFSLMTSLSDPGIIPRYPILRAINNGVIPDKFSKPKIVGEANIITEGKKFWRTWRIWRPERSSHCPDCDWWVEIFDHHCPYLNNCVGKRNYRYFIGFLTFLILNGVGMISSLIIFIVDSNIKNEDNMVVRNTNIAKIIVIIIAVASVVLLILVTALWAFHIYLITKGKTTKEKLTNKATKTNSKLLFWIIKDEPNFKGGNQWLSKFQHELYLEYCKEVSEGQIIENLHPQTVDLFEKQRRLMQTVDIEKLNKRNFEGEEGNFKFLSSLLFKCYLNLFHSNND